MEFDDEDRLPDNGFTRAVMTRIDRHRRRRRLAFATAMIVAAAIAMIVRPSLPAANLELLVLAPILISLCCLAWIETAA